MHIHDLVLYSAAVKMPHLIRPLETGKGGVSPGPATFGDTPSLKHIFAVCSTAKLII